MILHCHDELGSTSDEALRLAREGAPHGTVICARRQTAGRGRQGRRWISPAGNLHASFLLRPGVPAMRTAEIGFVAAVAVAATLDAMLPGQAALKWPNDVLLGGAKVAGILTELVEEAVIVGIGVNVAHVPPDMPYQVTSLAAQGCGATAEEVLASLMQHFEQGLAAWTQGGFGPVRAAWLQRGPSLGQAMRAGEGTGRFAGLAEDGALLLETENGTRRVVAGEVAYTGGRSIQERCPPLPAPVSRNIAVPPFAPTRT
jgi:BirA family transcriptional regulator, biotin operon repressor / biotin---[acetyl-CoA-carboxylase] ligase